MLEYNTITYKDILNNINSSFSCRKIYGIIMDKYTNALQELRSMIKINRKKKDLTLKELGDRVGLHSNFLGLFEKGESEISLMNFIKLIDELEIIDETNFVLKTLLDK